MSETKAKPSSIFAIASIFLLACAGYYFSRPGQTVSLHPLSQDMIFLLGGTLLSALAVVAGGLYPDLYARRSASIVSGFYVAAFVALSYTVAS